jgi:dolichol-phosphate mannosyltransferase
MRALVLVPTYNEKDNLPILAAGLLAHEGVEMLVIDDASPDGTGAIADAFATTHPTRVRVMHRSGPRGLGRSYRDGFRAALATDADVIVQMDADLSHDPKFLPSLIAGTADADLVIGSRYAPGGGVVDWGIARRVVSRGGSTFARLVLDLAPHDLTGGFKAWRASTLQAVPFDGIHAGGYVFQIEMTFRASRAGARIREIPITFHDRRVGQSKMSRRIVVEALVVVVQLRAEEMLATLRRRR